MFSVSTRGIATRALLYFSALLIALSYMLVAFINQSQTVLADEVSTRSIALGTSEEDAETTYTVTFTMPAGTTAGAFRVEFCDDDPLPHVACGFTAVGDDIPQVDTNAGSIVTLNGSSSATNATGGDCDGLTLAAPSVGDNHLDVTCTGADTFGGLASVVTLVFDDVDNPSNSTDSPANPNNSFYARIYAFSDETPPAYTDPVATTEVVHTGGIAMSTAEQLTITARVQEILEFCVGTSLASLPVDDCGDMTGNAVDLGVLDFATAHFSIADEGEQGSIMVRTNAAVGVVVDYFAEQASTGSNQLGALRVSGATCAADGPPSTDETDQCINSAGTTQAVITPAQERFGFCIDEVDDTSSVGTTTNNLTPDTQYDGTTSGCLVEGVAFDQTGTADRIATSVGQGGVVNDEMLVLDFGGTSDLTTPSGLYTVTLTFIGTATF
jgi:hypothetical protein